MITSTERITLRVEKGHDALFLVIVQKEPSAPCGSETCYPQEDNGIALNPGKESHGAADTQHQQGGAKIRLFHDEQSRNRKQQARSDQFLQRKTTQMRLITEKPRQGDDDDDLHDLARLHVETGQADPSCRAHTGFADSQNQYQQQQVATVEWKT